LQNGRIAEWPHIVELKTALDRLYESFNYPDSAADPIQIVRRYERPADREVVGFCAAALAFGRVTSVLQSIERLATIMGRHPSAYVRAFDPRRQSGAFAGLVHRWTRGIDLVALLWIVRQMMERSGSIEGFFLEGYDPEADDIERALDSFSTRARALDMKAAYGRLPKRPGVHYFFPRPSAGSACKRLNLFLRWMVRNDALDLGVAATRLGAGRETMEDTIDPGAGITVGVKIGDRVDAGDALAVLRFNDDAHLGEAIALAGRAFEIGDTSADAPPLVHEEVR